jgi:hypothetical protein
LEHTALLEHVLVNSPLDRLNIGVRNLDVTVEWKWLLALGNDLGLKVDDGRVTEESRLLSNSGDASCETICLSKANKSEWQDELLGVFNNSWGVFELEFEG